MTSGTPLIKLTYIGGGKRYFDSYCQKEGKKIPIEELFLFKPVDYWQNLRFYDVDKVRQEVRGLVKKDPATGDLIIDERLYKTVEGGLWAAPLVLNDLRVVHYVDRPGEELYFREVCKSCSTASHRSYTQLVNICTQRQASAGNLQSVAFRRLLDSFAMDFTTGAIREQSIKTISSDIAELDRQLACKRCGSTESERTLCFGKMPISETEDQARAEESALEVLKKRFAKGEITKEEYLEMRKLLEQ